jgi:hypothetical protein
MLQARILAGSLTFLALVASCVPTGTSSDRIAASVVLTKRAPDVNFASYRTFYVRPEIRELMAVGSDDVLDAGLAKPLVDETTEQLKNRGYVEVAKEDAQLAVELVYVSAVRSGTTCYSWYNSGYWGYPGYPYYPYYPCTASTWQANTLATTIVDLAAVQSPRVDSGTLVPPVPMVDGAVAPAPDGAVAQTAAPLTRADGAVGSKLLAGIWFSGIYGVSMTTSSDSVKRALDGIDQAFDQSPYLTSVR